MVEPNIIEHTAEGAASTRAGLKQVWTASAEKDMALAHLTKELGLRWLKDFG